MQLGKVVQWNWSGAQSYHAAHAISVAQTDRTEEIVEAEFEHGLTQCWSGIGTSLLLDELWNVGINFVPGVVG